MYCVLINRIKKSESRVKLKEKMLNFIVKWWKKTASFVVRKPTFAGKRRVSHDVIIALLKSSPQGKEFWRYHDVKTMAKWPKGINVTWSLFDRTLTLSSNLIQLNISIGWYMLLEHQVIWSQGEAAGPNHGARKAYTNRLSTWFAPKIWNFLYQPYDGPI